MKKVVSFCIFSVLLAVLSLGVKAQTPSGLTLSPANVTPQVGVQDTVYLIPGSCFDALGLADDDKVSIEWEILYNGSVIPQDSLTAYFVEFKFESKYNLSPSALYDTWWGKSYTSEYCYNGNGFGSYPGAYTPILDSISSPECRRAGHFAISFPGHNNPYEFDYFYVRFFKDAANTAHRLIYQPRVDGDYQFVLKLAKRCDGTKWDMINCNNDQRYYVGGHGSRLCGILSSDTLKAAGDTIPFETSICVGQTYTMNGMTFDHDTTDAYVTFYGISSCGASIDSVINLTLHVIDPVVPTLDTNNSVLQVCDEGDVTLVAVPQNAGANGVCIWFDELGNLIDTNNTITAHITANTEFYAVSYNPEGGCTSLDSLQVFTEVFVSPNPMVSVDTTEQCEGGEFNITLDQAYDQFTWHHDDNEMTETNVAFTITPAAAADAGFYFATVIDTNYHSVYNTMVACPATSDSVELVVYEHATATISQFDGADITAADQGVFCMNEVDHTITATITGGTAPYVLNWSNTAASHTIAGNVATATFSTVATCDTVTYTDTLIGGADAHNCSINLGTLVDVFYTLEDTDIPHIYVNATDTTAAPSFDGDCSYIIPDVTALVDSVVDACGTVTFAQNIAAGVRIYNDTTLWIVATDNCGHKDSTEISINIDFVDVAATDSVFQHVICSGDANGIIDVMVSNGVRPYTVTIDLVGSPETYTLTGGYTADTTFRFEGLVKGQWAVNVVDANGCTTMADTMDVSSPDILTLTTSNETNLTCWKDNSGKFDYTLDGGSAQYIVTISGPDSYEVIDTLDAAGTQNVTGLAAGEYTISVVDGHDCKDTVVVTLTQPDSLQITAISVLNNVRCYGELNGQLTATIAGGTADYVYTWKDSNDVVVYTETISATDNATGRILAAGTYTLSVTDANNCLCVDRTETITQHDTLKVDSIATPNAIECPYQGTYDVIAYVSGGTTNHTFTWTVNGANTDIPSNANASDTYTYTESAPVVCDTTFNISFKVVDDSACVASMDAAQFQIVDNTNPTIVGTLADTIVDGCNRNAATVLAPYATAAELVAAGLEITDDCTLNTDEFVVTFSDDTTDIACVGKLKAQIVRTYTVTDKCGNFVTTSHTIQIQDTIVPTFTRPADTTLYKDSTCIVDYTPAVAGDVTDEADNCTTTLNATYADNDVTPAGACTNELVIERTWSLVDECGNAAEDQVQTITIKDTIHPWFTLMPKDTVSYCEDDNLDAIRAAFKAYPTYTDNCGVPTMTVALDSIDTLCNNKTTIEYYTFTLTDECGLTTTANAMIYTKDTVKPRLTQPWFDVTLYDCGASDSIYDAWKYDIHITDDCNDTCWLVSYDSTKTPGCQLAFVEVGKWVFTDGCNLDSTTSTFSIIDQTPPYFAVEPQVNVTVECDGHGNLDTLMRWVNRVQAADNCDPNVTLNLYYEDINGNLIHWDTTSVAGIQAGFIGGGCSGYYHITWEAIDCSGNGRMDSVNPATTVEYFRITDSRGPVFEAPLADTVDCANWEAELTTWLSVPAAFDTCHQITYAVTNNSATQEFYSGCYGNGRNIFGTKYVTFTATDSCGKSTSLQSSFTVIDTTAPVVIHTGVADTLPTIYYNYRPTDCDAAALLADSLSAVTWILDTVGNHSDTLAHFIAAHSELGITSISDCAFPLGVLTVKRNTTGIDLVDESACENIYRLTYTVKDQCGNTTTLYQYVTIGDTTTPKGNNISSGTINLTDACVLADTLPVYTTVDELNGLGANITDCPSAELLKVEAGVDTYLGSLLTCDSAVVRPYTITDSCGNSLTIYDTIYVKDTVAPIISGAMPMDTVYALADCSGVTADTAARYAALLDTAQYAAYGWAMSVEDCTTINITRDSTIVTTADCPEKTILTYFTIDDGCAGNSTVFVDTLIVTDTVKPVVASYVHVDTVYSTDTCTFAVPQTVLDLATYADLYAYDNGYAVTECRLDSTVLIAVGGDTSANECVKDINFYYQVQDLCGNVSDGQFTVTIRVIDSVRPVATVSTLVEDTAYMVYSACANTDVTSLYWTSIDDAVDHGYTVTDCNIDSLSFAIDSIHPVADSGCYVLDTVEYTVSDSCGNALLNNIIQVIRVLDTTGPAIAASSYLDTLVVDMIEDTTGLCGGGVVDTFQINKDLYDYNNSISGSSHLVIRDCNYDHNTAVELLASTSADTVDMGCTKFVYRHYQVYDVCGNAANRILTQVIRINDVTAPQLNFTELANDTVYMTEYSECDLNAADEYTSVAALLADYPQDSIIDCNLSDVLTCVADTTWAAAGLAPAIAKIHRIYTVSDECGHTSTFTHDIYSFDTLSPIIVAADTDVLTNLPMVQDSMVYSTATLCAPAIPAAFTSVAQVLAYSGISEINDCQLLDTVMLISDDTLSGICPDTIVRHYNVIDSTGNTAEFVQYIFIADTVHPILTGTLDTLNIYTDTLCSFEVDSTALPVYTTVAELAAAHLIVTDCHMDGISISFADSVYTNHTACPVGKIVRYYTIADTCGNDTTAIQIIHINDTIAPTLDSVMIDTIAAVSEGSCTFSIPDFTDTIANHIVDECGANAAIVSQSPVAGTVITSNTDVNVVFADHCGNKDSVTIVVTIPSALAIDTAYVDSVSCHSMLDGSVFVAVTGGTDTYVDSLYLGTSLIIANDGIASDSLHPFTGLAAGDYTVVITDADGCKISTDLTVKQPDTLIVTASLDNAVICDNDSTIFISEVASTGLGTAPYNYTWDLIDLSTDDTTANYFTAVTEASLGYIESAKFNLEAGQYKMLVTVVDARGCSDTASAVLTVNPTYEFQDTARVCYGIDYNWVDHRVINASEITVADTVYTFYDSLTVASTGCDSVWILNLTVTNKPFLTIRDRNNNADESTLQEADIHATVSTGNYAAGELGYEIFVNKNCTSCSDGLKVDLNYTLYRYDSTVADYVQITSDVDDYFTPTYLTYLDQAALAPQTITTGPVQVPASYPAITAMHYDYDYFYLCWMDPDYACSPALQTNSGIGYMYGRPSTIGFTQFRTPGQYMITVDLRKKELGSDYMYEGYCPADGKMGGTNSVLAADPILESVNIFLNVEGAPLALSAPIVDPMEGVVTPSEVGQVPVAKVFPNPARDYVTVELSGFEGETDIMLSNANGETMKKLNVNIGSDSTPIIKISTADYAQGVYMVTARNNKVVVTKRVVIVK